MFHVGKHISLFASPPSLPIFSLSLSPPIFFVLCQPLVFFVSSSALTHALTVVFILNVPVVRWAPAARLWTATSSRWRSVWCARTWRETRCSGPADTSPPAPCARLVSRSVSSARIRSSQEPRYQTRYCLSHPETRAWAEEERTLWLLSLLFHLSLHRSKSALSALIKRQPFCSSPVVTCALVRVS